MHLWPVLDYKDLIGVEQILRGVKCRSREVQFLGEQYAAAAIGRASQPPPAQPSPLPAPTATTPAVRPSWPPTPTRPMCEEEHAYYTYYATNLDSLAPKYQAATTVSPPAADTSMEVCNNNISKFSQEQSKLIIVFYIQLNLFHWMISIYSK